ncbi:MAG: hypothetical protein A4E53_01255 [Pelotomaculum sp. PtaB.Bin104]|nr:MAG: hypothetical protein A4E53_01255 [Pelotomaculum sp. PtaB.Bin104]
MTEIADMSFGWLLTIVAGGLTMISLGVMIVVVNILKSFQK